MYANCTPKFMFVHRTFPTKMKIVKRRNDIVKRRVLCKNVPRRKCTWLHSQEFFSSTVTLPNCHHCLKVLTYLQRNNEFVRVQDGKDKSLLVCFMMLTFLQSSF